jgi:seryl-tRNA synthetase
MYKKCWMILYAQHFLYISFLRLYRSVFKNKQKFILYYCTFTLPLQAENTNFFKTMLTVKTIIENREETVRRLAVKHFDATEYIDKVIDSDTVRRNTQSVLDANLAEINTISKKIGALIKEGKKEEAEAARAQVSRLKEHVKKLETTKEDAEKTIHGILLLIPNLPHESVPEGKSAEDNVCEKTGGTIPSLPEDALPHWELAKKYNLIDFELGVKITGAGFPVYTGLGARLQRALIDFFLDNADKAGYTEIQPPYAINADSGYGTGNLPDKEGQMYYCEADNLYLIPTAEIPVTNIYRDVILDKASLPIKNTAYSACFRREAGSYGKDVRGLNRLHQFDKVEIVRIDTPEHSYRSLQEMVDYVESLVEKLELPWRILRLCGSDMSFTSSLTFDFEVFSAAQKRWLEVSSVSNFESYQANRLKCRYRDDNKKTQLCHTLNGSALALPRIVAAMLENNQTPEGIRIPKALVPYTRFEMIK